MTGLRHLGNLDWLWEHNEDLLDQLLKLSDILFYYLLPPTAQIMIQHDLDAQWKSGECVLLILENCNKYAYSSHLITLD